MKQYCQSGIYHSIFIIRKGRMADSKQKGKIVSKLLKIISQKQDTIQFFKRNTRQLEKQLKESQQILTQTFHNKLKEENCSCKSEVKQINLNILSLNQKISELTEALRQEIAVNEELEEKIAQFSRRQKEQEESIQTLKAQIDREKIKNEELILQKQQHQKEKTDLIFKIQESSIQKQYENILEAKIEKLTKNLIEYEKYDIKIGDFIDNIYSKYCQNQLKRSSNKQIKPNIIHQRIEDLSAKLEQIEMSFINNLGSLDDENVLNQTIDGLSIILKSFQERLEDGVCFTERRNSTANSDCNRLKQKSPPQASSHKLMLLSKDSKDFINLTS